MTAAAAAARLAMMMDILCGYYMNSTLCPERCMVRVCVCLAVCNLARKNVPDQYEKYSNSASSPNNVYDTTLSYSSLMREN